MPTTPKPRARLDRQARRAAASERARDIFMRLRAVAPDPDGKHLWLLLDPKPEDPGTVH